MVVPPGSRPVAATTRGVGSPLWSAREEMDDVRTWRVGRRGLALALLVALLVVIFVIYLLGVVLVGRHLAPP